MEYKEDSRLCIVVIPKTQKVKRIIIPDWLPKFIVALTVVIGISIAFHYNKVTAFTNDLQVENMDKNHAKYELEKEIQSLEKISKTKDRTILALESNAIDTQEKIDEVDNIFLDLEKLQKQLEKKAGISTASRANGISRPNDLENLESDESLEALKKILDEKESELENFIVEIDNRFKYLETVPNLWPTQGRLTSKYGNRKNPFGRGIKFHKGIDKSGYGRVVMIKHSSEYETLYAHNSKNLVKVGDKVKKGQVIAKMGSSGRSTGSHLHFEIHKNGNVINPLKVLNK